MYRKFTIFYDNNTKPVSQKSVFTMNAYCSYGKQFAVLGSRLKLITVQSESKWTTTANWFSKTKFLL